MATKKRPFDDDFKLSVVEDAEQASMSLLVPTLLLVPTRRHVPMTHEVYCRRPRVNATLEQSPLHPAC